MRKYVVLLCMFTIGFATSRAIAGSDAVLEPDLGVVDRVESLWRSGAIPSALIVAAFAVLSWARAHLAWLRQGHRATLTAAAIGGLGMLVQTAANGVTPNASMIMVAATTAMAIAMNPKVEAKPDGAA
jgi:hypothetical protein